MIVPVPLTDPTTQLNLEPGFRFNPTDEELIVQYLYPKVAGIVSPLLIIREVDLYKFDPWELPSKAMFGEKEWYFFSSRDRKYPNGDRPNRVVGSGYWKATGTDKVIMSGNQTLGIKKALVFYVGKAKKGYKTDWIMHEYRLSESSTKDKTSSRLDDWVLCRIYMKNSHTKKTISSGPSIEQGHYSPEMSLPSSLFDNILNSHPATLPEMEDKSVNTQTNHSMSAFNEKNQKVDNQKFNAESDDWMSVRGFAYPNQINNDNMPNLASVDPIFNTNMKFVELLELPDDDVQTTMLPSLFNTTDPFAIRYPTHQSSSSGYIP